MDHNVFNLDFIAFGKFNKTRKGNLQLRDPVRIQFFQNLAESGFVDSFSLYTLELFEWSDWYNSQIPHYSHLKEWFGLKKYGSDDEVYEEFEVLKSILLDAGYRRYEISNYSLAGKNSIHNRVYRSLGERLGLGTWAISHLLIDKEWEISKDIISKHITMTSSLKEFVWGNYIDEKKTEYLTEDDYQKEKFLMGLRTMEWIQLGEMWKILLSNREEKVTLYQAEWLCIYDGDRLQLTDEWMDVYNSFVTEIMR